MQVRKLIAVGVQAACWLCGAVVLVGNLRADEPKNPADPSAPLKRLVPDYDVWVDYKNKQVVMQGEICLTRGPLEMFAVTKGTKEHESVVSVNTKAYIVHTGLLILGAVPGTTVKYEPKFAPPTGTKVEIWAYWMDEKGNQQKTRAQNWVQDVKTKKAMTQPFVFAGSGFYVDEATKNQYYMAEAGDFICVSNFPDAMLDVPIESTSDNDDLLFEAFTENIPPKGTKVTLVLMPQIEKKGADEKSEHADKAGTEKPDAGKSEGVKPDAEKTDTGGSGK